MVLRAEGPVRVRSALQAAPLLVALLMATASPSHAQQNMVIRKTDNTVVSIPVADIVSITFSGAPAVASGATVTDIDGNVYATVTIGSQVWMADNLRTTRYRNGQPIEYPGPDRPAWAANRSGAYAWYNDDERVFKQPYGAVYNWYAVSNSKGLCPAGWHVPSQSEWQLLQEAAGGSRVAGGKLKSGRTAPELHPRWDAPNTSATNETGFSAVPSGSRHFGGTYADLGQRAAFWSATPTGTAADSPVYDWGIRSNSGQIGSGFTSRNTGHAVRCVRD